MTISRDGRWGVWVPPYFNRASLGGEGTLMDAAGEKIHMTGHVVIPGGGSKTISAAGGGGIIYHTRTASNVFSNASTTVRIGIQDTDTTTASPTIGDGTFDVYGDRVGGTDAWVNDTTYTETMSSGTKTLADGDLITIAFEMVSRGGTDAVSLYTWNVLCGQIAPGLLPVASQNTGTWAVMNYNAVAGIIFDDGTVGYLRGGPFIADAPSTAVNVSSDPDEYGNYFSPSIECKAIGIHATVGIANASADFELCLYSDPMGSPSLIEAITIDSTGYYINTNQRQIVRRLTTKRALSPGTVYGVTVRPTTANNVTVSFTDFGNAGFREQFLGGTKVYAIERTDNSGAFTEYQSAGTGTRWANVGLILDGYGIPERVVGQ